MNFGWATRERTGLDRSIARCNAKWVSDRILESGLDEPMPFRDSIGIRRRAGQPNNFGQSIKSNAPTGERGKWDYCPQNEAVVLSSIVPRTSTPKAYTGSDVVLPSNGPLSPRRSLPPRAIVTTKRAGGPATDQSCRSRRRIQGQITGLPA